MRQPDQANGPKTMTTNDKLVEAFDKFKSQIDEWYDVVREHIAAGRYVQANDALAHIAQIHAKTSLSMRNFLVKNNLINGDDT